MHFLGYRTRDRNLQKIQRFCEWIIREIAL
jgi:hypothetical protein